MKRLILAAALIVGVPVSAQTITPQFTQGSYTSNSTSTQTVNETIQQQVFGSAIKTWSGTNVSASGDILDSATTFSIVDTSQPWQLETTTRAAGLIEQIDIDRTITTTTTTTGLSVFSQ
ncbi:MAG: hypothetical protein VW840_20670 [Gammaproteobacteria bacterium]|jgi:hypothetical protein